MKKEFKIALIVFVVLEALLFCLWIFGFFGPTTIQCDPPSGDCPIAYYLLGRYLIFGVIPFGVISLIVYFVIKRKKNT